MTLTTNPSDPSGVSTNNPHLTTCKSCGTQIAKNAKVCPACGAKNGKPIYKKWWFWVILIVIICGIGGTNKDSPSKALVAPPSHVTEPLQNSVSNGTSQENTQSPSSKVAEPKSEQEIEKIPTEYKSALKKAKTYSDMMHMSKASIYDQLTSDYGERFSAEAAQYAMDNLEADWKNNALKKAKTYSDTMHMSKAGIYDQLISEYGEKFTSEEAQYAVDNVNADWKANALKKAETYQNMMNMSPAFIHDQLTSEYGEKFTKEEADYAIEHLE